MDNGDDKDDGNIYIRKYIKAQILITSCNNTQMASQQRSGTGTWGMAKKKVQV